MTTSSWLAYLCAMQGHVVRGVGVGTGTTDVVWSDRCERCGGLVAAVRDLSATKGTESSDVSERP